MKLMHMLTILMAAGVMIGTAGCSTTPKAPATKSELKVTETIEVNVTVTADQAILMDGRKLKVADIPAQLVKKNVDKYITVIVMPESKMTRETMIELIQALVQNDYLVTIAASSKYADVPIPGRS